MKAAGILDMVEEIPLFVRKTDIDIKFELSAAFGDELESDDEYNLIDGCHYNLYYYRVINGLEEKLVAKIKREGVKSHFYFVSQDENIGGKEIYFATVTHYENLGRFDISNLN